MEELDLARRSGLPDALRVLLEEIPREQWEGHANFGQMVQFWLRRHLMFREVLTRISDDAEAFLDARSGRESFAPRLVRLGGFFLGELHAHHQIEDALYFPRLVDLDPRLSRGFAMLEADHQAIDGLLSGFAAAANAVLAQTDDAAMREAAATLRRRAAEFGALLDRHLTDEEELVVPVILKTGFED